MTAPHRPPRISPGGRAELGPVTWGLLWLLGKRYKSTVPNIMLVLGRHRKLFAPWLWFASRLMPNGSLPAQDSELVILRVGARCGSEYERAQHVPLAKRAGLHGPIIEWTTEPVDSSAPAPAGGGIDSDRATLLVRATDELIDEHNLSDEIWEQLAAIYKEHELIEFCMLVGHYVMLAGTLNSVGVQLEAEVGVHNLR